MDGTTTVTRTRRWHRVAVVINDMNATGGIQRVAANLVRDLRAFHDTVLLSVEPLKAPVIFHEPGLDFQSLDRRQSYFRRGGRLMHFAGTGLAMRRWGRAQRHRYRAGDLVRLGICRGGGAAARRQDGRLRAYLV